MQGHQGSTRVSYSLITTKSLRVTNQRELQSLRQRSLTISLQIAKTDIIKSLILVGYGHQ